MTAKRHSSVQDVGHWLKSNGMPHLVDTFAANAVSGEDLLSLSEDDLVSHLGCTSLQARKILREFGPQPSGPRLSDPPPPPYISDEQQMIQNSPSTSPVPGNAIGATMMAYVSLPSSKVCSVSLPSGFNQPQYPQPQYIQPQYIQQPQPSQQQIVYYAPVPQENYCGPWSWVICCCLGFPCIACCPVDQRPIEYYPQQVIHNNQQPVVVNGVPYHPNSPSSMQMQR